MNEEYDCEMCHNTNVLIDDNGEEYTCPWCKEWYAQRADEEGEEE